MIITAAGFSALLHSLGLAQGSSKPAPSSLKSSHTSGRISVGDLPPNVSTGDSEPVQAQGGGCTVEAYEGPTYNITFSPFDQAQANVFRYRQQQSVNLGSWLVHENWMTPSLFACAAGKQLAELDLAYGWGSQDSARAALEKHWDTFITQQDLHYLASIGINTVRLPIGYWNLGPAFCQGTDFEPVAGVYQNAWSRVVNAINMASIAGIGVLVDFHGAPGSQNGQPHSGISDGKANLFNDPWNINKAVDCLTFLAQQLVAVTNVVGIEILNEPANVPTLTDFYTQAISSMRAVSPEAASFPLYLHDGFDLQRFSDYIANRTDFVVQDHHSYFVYTPSDSAEPADDHTVDVQTTVDTSLAEAAANQHGNLVVDEWSCALTPQSLAAASDPQQAQQGFCTGQMGVYTGTVSGWSFWSYTKEQCEDDPGWCFKAAVGKTLPPTFFAYQSLSDTGPQSQAVENLQLNVKRSDLLSRRSHPEDTEPNTAPHEYAIRSRRILRFSSYSQHGERDDSDPVQKSITKGYSDGYNTAKIFAAHGMSKLGFIDQYVSDSLAALGSAVIQPGTEQFYKDWFMKGLRDAEDVVAAGRTA